MTEHEFAHHEDPGVASGIRPLVQRRRMTYTYHPPYAAVLRLDYLDAGGTNVIVFAVQPMRGRTLPGVHHADPQRPRRCATGATPREFEQRVLEEDLVVQRRMLGRMPLDRTVEVHTRADRLTIELRRSLAELAASGPAPGCGRCRASAAEERA